MPSTTPEPGPESTTTTPAEQTDVLTASDSTGATTDTVVLIPPSAKVDTADEVEKVDKPTEAAAKPAVKVIVIDDDDRPDALYLDEESGTRPRDVHDDESGGRSTIIIKDLDESGSIEALPARSTGSMDPRFAPGESQFAERRGASD